MSIDDELGVAREHAELADWDAAYVLGALTPADRRRYERHVDTCARCRTAVAELSGLPGLLADVPMSQVLAPADVDDLPEDLLPRLSAAVVQRRRSRVRYAVLGGLVAAAAVVLALVVFRPASSTGPTPGPGTGSAGASVDLALQPVVPNPLAVDVALVEEPWGTRLDLKCQFADDGRRSGPNREYGYTLFATNRAGSTMQVGSWRYGPDTVAEPTGTSGWPVDQIASIEVRSDNGTVLLRGSR